MLNPVYHSVRLNHSDAGGDRHVAERKGPLVSCPELLSVSLSSFFLSILPFYILLYSNIALLMSAEELFEGSFRGR